MVASEEQQSCMVKISTRLGQTDIYKVAPIEVGHPLAS
jgi:hypothetical protein